MRWSSELRSILLLTLSALLHSLPVEAQTPEFQWVNQLPKDAPAELRHGSYSSKVNQATVGYVILLPPGYDDAANSSRRYPVVYYLHGGRPGSEIKSVRLAEFIQPPMASGAVAGMIYVFVNGGLLSHYDHEGSLGETTFVSELIPHIDATYRTIAERNGRGLEGFSQGGRGTARIMFKHPDLFVSAGPMGGGHQYEKVIDENNGVESEGVVIRPPWNNTWELARRFARKKDAPKLNILVVVGTKDQNYKPNLSWMTHLDDLGISYQKIILEGVPHSAVGVYEKRGTDFLRFHAGNFERALGRRW